MLRFQLSELAIHFFELSYLFFWLCCACITTAEPADALDDGEQFMMLERTRVTDEDPDSLSYYNASKGAKKKSRLGKARKPLATKLGMSGRV